jgi:hypothetical protein
MNTKRANLHPASVVRPSCWKTGKDRGNPAAAAAARRGIGRKTGAGIVVHVKTVWSTTSLGGISRAGHVAITGRFRDAAIGDGSTAVFGKHGEWTSAADRGCK